FDFLADHLAFGRGEFLPVAAQWLQHAPHGIVDAVGFPAIQRHTPVSHPPAPGDTTRCNHEQRVPRRALSRPHRPRWPSLSHVAETSPVVKERALRTGLKRARHLRRMAPVLPNPDIDPVLIRLGPIILRWYGRMYVLGLPAPVFMIKARAAARNVALAIDDLHDLILYAALGVILGGRLGYVFFYNLPYYLDHPAKLAAVWEGGMSFHGGLLGVIGAVGAFCWRKGYASYIIADLATPTVQL